LPEIDGDISNCIINQEERVMHTETMYTRQMAFAEIGSAGQKRLSSSKVAIVGCGALGSTSAEILTRSGIGHLILIDRDIIEETNIQSQNLFRYKDIGKPKATTAKEILKKVNPEIRIEAFAVDLDSNNADLMDADLVLDCTDNFATRFLINDYCKKYSIPWVYCGVIGSKGSVLSFTPDCGYCFECVFGGSKSDDTCETEGVIAPAAHVAAALQAVEAIKILTGKKPLLELINFDLWDNSFFTFKVSQNDSCVACKGKFLNLNKKIEVSELCGSRMFQIKGIFDYEYIKKKFSSKEGFADLKVAFRYKNVTFFPERALIRAGTKEEAEEIFYKYIGVKG